MMSCDAIQKDDSIRFFERRGEGQALFFQRREMLARAAAEHEATANDGTSTVE